MVACSNQMWVQGGDAEDEVRKACWARSEANVLVFLVVILIGRSLVIYSRELLKLRSGSLNAKSGEKFGCDVSGRHHVV